MQRQTGGVQLVVGRLSFGLIQRSECRIVTHRVVVIKGSTSRTLDWSDDSLGEMTGSVRRIVTNFVIGVLSESEAARMLITEGFTAQTALRILAMNATKLLAASRSRDEAMAHRRIIIHNGFARDAGSPKDGVGSPEEIAFGEGYHSSENYNPYTSATEKAAWEKGRAAKKQKYRLNQLGAAQGIAAPGMKRKVAFQPPRARVGADKSGDEIRYGNHVIRETTNYGEQVFTVFGPTSPSGGRSYLGDFGTLPSAKNFIDRQKGSKDYKSEKGYVAKLIDVKTGRELARSEPYISNGPSLKSWVQAKAQELISQGKRVKAEIAFVFFDPNQAFDARARDNYYHAGQVNGYYILEGAQGDKGRWLVRNGTYDIVKTASSLAEAQSFARSQKPITAPIETKIAADRRSTDAAYLDPKPGAPHVDLLLADALSPKGEWVGPYVQGKLGGYVQAPGSSGYRPYYISHAPHARKLLAVRSSTK
jgi:hypothetical protein